MVSTSSTTDPTGSPTPFEYAPAPESRSVVDIRSSYGLFIDGEFVDGVGGTSFKTVNPATEEVLAEVSEAQAADVDLAVKAARRAYTRVWSRMPGRERSKYLFRIARIMQERARELAVLESIDNGKPIREARDVDVPTAAGDLVAVLEGAGFRQVTVGHIRFSVPFRQSSELWDGILRSGVRFPPLVLAQTPAVRAQLRTAFDRYVGRFAQADGSLEVPTSIQVASARRP